MRRPVNSPYTVTSNHGEYVGSNARFQYHSGYDYAVPLNRAVFAPANGRITFAGWSNTGGNMIVLHDGVFYHRLMHNVRLRVSAGQNVSEGQHIADAGTTGLSTGVHVHWDICKRETAQSFSDFIDNDPWLKGSYNHLYQSTQGDKPMNKDEEANAYRIVLNRSMEHGGSGRTGYKFIVDAEAEVKAARTAIQNQVQALQTALQNEQNKPPKEVVKEVEKIVEKIMEVEKTVYTHDEETKQNVSAILKLVKTIRAMLPNLFKLFKK